MSAMESELKRSISEVESDEEEECEELLLLSMCLGCSTTSLDCSKYKFAVTWALSKAFGDSVSTKTRTDNVLNCALILAGESLAAAGGKLKEQEKKKKLIDAFDSYVMLHKTPDQPNLSSKFLEVVDRLPPAFESVLQSLHQRYKGDVSKSALTKYNAARKILKNIYLPMWNEVISSSSKSCDDGVVTIPAPGKQLEKLLEKFLRALVKQQQQEEEEEDKHKGAALLCVCVCMCVFFFNHGSLHIDVFHFLNSCFFCLDFFFSLFQNLIVLNLVIKNLSFHITKATKRRRRRRTLNDPVETIRPSFMRRGVRQ
jgi:hypothetical protein